MGRIAKGLVFGLTCLLPLGCADGGSAKKLSGSGSTFVKPVMDKWIDVYSKEKGGFEINYQGQGSTAGIKQMTEKAVNFGCTDAAMTPEQREKARKEGGEVVHVPLVMGGVVPAYNLPDLDKPLNFTGEVLAGIFLGEITNWNDERIKADNKNVSLPDLKISVVHRAEGSGTTAIFTEYLCSVSSKWKSDVGTNTTVDWPVGSGEKGNPAVADNVGRNAGSIGYVELLYALQKKNIQFGAVRNRAGKFIRADLKSVRAAAGSLKQYPDDLCFSIVKDYEGEDAYPICGTTWAVLYQNQSGDTGRELVKFLTWIVHDGQKYAERMHYAPLPENLVQRIDEKLKAIKIE
ncbi:MAG TPA: phosphate ABC transporter substrate-binding protein PstS [Gemmataceae bacterium]